MGKNLRQQRRGRGSPRYRSPSHRAMGKPKYIKSYNGSDCTIKSILHARMRRGPLAIIESENQSFLNIAHDGASVGQSISSGPGSITELSNIPEGTRIFNLEIVPGDGGKLCRSPGSSAILVAKEANKCVIMLPSKKKKSLPSKCRATIGVPACGGASEKPFMKAGNKFYSATSFNRYWPMTSAVAKNAVDHPFGGQTKPGKHKSVSRHAPPGRKVGALAPRRLGKKKRK